MLSAGRSCCVVFAAFVLLGCRCVAHEEESSQQQAPPMPALMPAPPKQLYLPDAGSNLLPLPGVTHALQVAGRCPPEMVDIRGEYCIDRHEMLLVDSVRGQRLSPYYHPTRTQALKTFEYWQGQSKMIGPGWARTMPLPDLPAWQRERELSPAASNQRGEIPSGYLSADLAEQSCQRAGKRLCSEQEWVMACRGEQQRKFPYGDEYQHGVCNVFRDTHPAQVLHRDPSEGHLDPRLNLVKEGEAPLLMTSGSLPNCASRWGNDAVYDMVGNLDEWIADPLGKFLGGFYARSTREGCDAAVGSHARGYFDYSLGGRCCR